MEKLSYEELEQKVSSLEDKLFFLGAQFEEVEKQLRQRQRMDSLGMLALGVAHDFNNILSGIMAYLNILTLTSDNFTASQKKYIRYIINAVRRGAATIKQFQTLSARNQSSRDSVDVHKVAREVFDMLEEITDKMILKKLDIEDNRFFILADVNEIHQVLLNLGTNAIHAIEEKGIQQGDYIRMSLEAVSFTGDDPEIPLAGDFYRIRFEDTGNGIPEDLQEKIFDPLFTTKAGKVNKGQGLGLAMVHDIVTKRHGGQIKVSSKPGKGTVFELYLPVADSAGSDANPEIVIQGGSEKILVVDDDSAIRESMKTALEDFGYSVLTAVDGEHGLKVYRENYETIDAVVLDIVMPKMSGKELLREMLKIDPDVKVIISSGHMENQIGDAIIKSASNYLKKPYEIDVLENTLRQVLDL